MLWRPESGAAGAQSYDQAVLSELQMLLEFIAGRPELTIRDLTVTDPAQPDRPLVLPQVTARLSEIEDTLDAAHPLGAADRTLLLSVRDALNAIVRPASGMTIAYTALVLRTTRGRFSKARLALAQRAFPGMETAATWHRWSHIVLLVIAVCLTFSAVWESTKVALGQSLLRSRGDLRVEQDAISAEKMRLEATLTRDPALSFEKIDLGDGRTLALRLCDRPKLLSYAALHGPPPLSDVPQIMQAADNGVSVALFESPEQQDVCDRDRLLGYRFGSSLLQLQRFRADWSSMVGAGFPLVGRLAHAASFVSGWLLPAQPAGKDVAEHDDDVEYSIAPDLLVTGNYVLPVIFAMLGSCAYAVLDFYGKARRNLLVPGDRMLSWIRLTLGMLIGACIGLFVNSGQPATPLHSDNLLSALTLSASGLAFIGGYGVEGVFAMLNVLVGRVFDPKGAAASG